MTEHKGLPILSFADQAAWDAWHDDGDTALLGPAPGP